MSLSRPSACPIFVINLDRSPERLASMQHQLTRLGLSFQRVEAIDGAGTTTRDWRGIRPLAPYFSALSAREMACCASHVKALELIAGMDVTAALVLEDDVEIGSGLPGALDELASRATQLPDSTSLFGHRARGRLLHRFPSGRRLIESVTPPISAAAIVWTPAGARRFLPSARSMLRPIDVARKHWWDSGLSHAWLCGTPVSLKSNLSDASTIGLRRSRGTIERINKLCYRSRFTASSHWHYLLRFGFGAWLQAQTRIGARP